MNHSKECQRRTEIGMRHHGDPERCECVCDCHPINLKGYQSQVRKLAELKGYNQELFYLFSRMVQEGSEMLDAIWQNKSDEEVAEEGADLLHFFFQMLDKRPNADIDMALNEKIEKNYVTKKKTNENGTMVRK